MIAYCLNRVGRALKLTCCSQKNMCLFKFCWEVCKINMKKKKVNVIIIITTMIIEYA